MAPLTVRDAGIVGLQSLASLRTARTDTPTSLPSPSPVLSSDRLAGKRARDDKTPLRDNQDDFLAMVLRCAIRARMRLSPSQADAVRQQAAGLNNVGEARAFVAEVAALVVDKRKARRTLGNIEIRRLAFERWLRRQYPQSDTARFDGQYGSRWVQAAWSGWQAAQSVLGPDAQQQRLDGIRRRNLRELCEQRSVSAVRKALGADNSRYLDQILNGRCVLTARFCRRVEKTLSPSAGYLDDATE
jgi:hypothetical protein